MYWRLDSTFTLKSFVLPNTVNHSILYIIHPNQNIAFFAFQWRGTSWTGETESSSSLRKIYSHRCPIILYSSDSSWNDKALWGIRWKVVVGFYWHPNIFRSSEGSYADKVLPFQLFLSKKISYTYTTKWFCTWGGRSYTLAGKYSGILVSFDFWSD